MSAVLPNFIYFPPTVTKNRPAVIFLKIPGRKGIILKRCIDRKFLNIFPMKTSTRPLILFVLVFALTLLAGRAFAQLPCCNILTNGDFEQGNTGFTSGLPLNCACVANSYCVGANFQVKCPPPGWPNFTDHTSGSGNFLIVDGNETGPVDVWRFTTPLVAGNTYCFSFWVASVYDVPFDLGITVNGVLLPGAQFTVQQGGPSWTQYTYTWVATGGSNVAIRQMSGGQFRDFGLDDIVLGGPITPNFAFQPDIGCGMNVAFFNQSTGPAALTASWNFGDPASGLTNTSTAQNPTHKFTDCGAYEVCLTVSRGDCSETICQEILVEDIDPPTALCAGVSIELGADCMAAVTPNMIDGGSTDNCYIASMSVSPNKVTGCGFFPITLTVTDSCGSSSSCIVEVQAAEAVPPLITCPANLSVNAIPPDCAVIVNGIGWLTLSDNCGVPTVNHVITGATQTFGIKDASGTTFNQGVSVVTYTATDQCGNTATCSFAVTVECVEENCACPGSGTPGPNLVANGHFESGAVGFSSGLGGPSGCGSNSYLVAKNFQAKCSGWPSLMDHTTGTGNFLIVDSDPTGPVDVWSQSVNVVAGMTYCFSFWVASVYAQPFDLDVTIFDQNGATATLGTASVNQPVPGWVNYTFTWACPAGWLSGTSTLSIIDVTGGEFHDFGIDDICFRKSNCCSDYDAFLALVAQGFTIQQEGCTITVCAPQFDSCHYFGTEPTFGDGTPVPSVTVPANGCWSHTYAQSGTYTICATVYEDDCWSEQMCATVIVCCNNTCPANLVSNPGFENGPQGFPTGADQIGLCTDWHPSNNSTSVTGIGDWWSASNPFTPGFYTSGPSQVTVMQPHCGTKYAGVDLNSCEGISSTLLSPITQGCSYEVGFWWSPSDVVTAPFTFFAIMSGANCTVYAPSGSCSHQCGGDQHVVVNVIPGTHVPGTWYYHTTTITNAYPNVSNITFAAAQGAPRVANYIFIDDVCVQKVDEPCTVNADIICYPGTSSYTAQATVGCGSAVTQVDWYFDGVGPNPSSCCLNSVIHPFTTIGLHTVCLVVTATTSTGEVCRDTVCKEVFVEYVPPTKCDSVGVYWQKLHTVEDLCCYALQLDNMVPNCFTSMEVTLNSGDFTNAVFDPAWNVVGNPATGGPLYLTPIPGVYVPTGFSTVFTLCQPGGSNPHVLNVNLLTGIPTGLDTCEWVFEFDCFEPPPTDSCCLDYDLFCQNVMNAVSLTVDQANCKATLNIGNLPDCDHIESVLWGDGSQSLGPFVAGDMPMHTYSSSGTYVVQWLAIELDPHTGLICFEKFFSDTIVLDCGLCVPTTPQDSLCDAPIDVLFILDNSGSIDFTEFVTMQNLIASSVAQIQTAYSNAWFGSVHYSSTWYNGGAYGDLLYVENDFAPSLGSVNRQFFGNDELDPTLANVIDALNHTPNINLRPTNTSWLNRRPGSNLLIVLFTDAVPNVYPAGSSMLPYTNSCLLKQAPHNASITVVHLEPTIPGVDAVSAAIASPGGTWTGVTGSNGCDPGTLPRQYIPWAFGTPGVFPILPSLPPCDSLEEEDCCDSLMVMPQLTTIGGQCCATLNLKNKVGYPVVKFEAELVNSPGWVFNAGSLAIASGYNWAAPPTAMKLCLGHSSGQFPVGATSAALTYCLASTSPTPSATQMVIFKWYGILPGETEAKIVCLDTLIMECPPTPGESCVALVESDVECNPDNPYEYFLNFTVQNLTGAPMYQVVLQNLPPGYGFSLCNASTAVPSLALNLSPYPLPNGATSNNLCVKIISPFPILSPTQVCFRLGLVSPATCCHAPNPVCVTLERCCDPCEGVEAVPQALPGTADGCCYKLDLLRECQYKMFSRIETEILTPGVIFGYHALGGPDAANWFVYPGATPTSISYGPYAGLITQNLVDDIIQFCLDGITPTTPTPQTVVVRWYTGLPPMEMLVCTDTLTFECEDDVECVWVDPVIECIPDSNKYMLTMTVTNHSSIPFNATDFHVLVISPSNLYLTPTGGIFQLTPTLPSGSSTTVTTCIETTGAFPPTDPYIVLSYRLGWFNGASFDTCCFEDKLDTIPLPPCDTCVCHSELSLSSGGSEYPVFCDPHTGFIPSLDCPAEDVVISGFFGCINPDTGEPCEETEVIWEFIKPDNSTQGGVTTNFVNFTFPAGSVAQPGVYCLNLTTICPDGDTCFCKVSWVQEPCDTLCDCAGTDNLSFVGLDTIAGGVVPVFCGSPDTLVIPCDVSGTGTFWYHGDMHCTDDSCLQDDFTWSYTALSPPFGTVTNTGTLSYNNGQDGHFDILLNYADYTPGVNYALTVTHYCGNKPCPCTVYFRVEECDSCCTNYDAFLAAAAAVDPQDVISDCFISVNATGLNDCLQVVWDWGDGSPVEGPFPDNTPVSHTFSPTGPYTVCYTVQEVDANGDVCWEAQFCVIGEVFCGDSCCTDSLAFVNAAANVQTNGTLGNCTLTFQATGLTDCMRISYDWGDGSAVVGPYTNNTLVTHTYPGTGTYVVCYYIQERDLTGAVCWVYERCDSVYVICDGCCVNFDLFCQNVMNAVNVTVDNANCKATLNVGDLPPCDYIEWVDWGDGVTTFGPFTSGAMPMHTYMASGSYIISYLAIEIDPATGLICFEKILHDTITVNCSAVCPGCPPGTVQGPNLVANGDFSAGPNLFTTGYAPYFIPGNPTIVGDWSVLSSNTEVNAANSQWSGFGHTTGLPGDNFLVLDGVNFSSSGAPNAWEQTVAVQTGRQYRFCLFVNNLVKPPPATDRPDPVIEVWINGTLVAGPLVVPENPDNWVLMTAPWASGVNTSALIEIRSTSFQAVGNDYALDDISLRECKADTCGCGIYDYLALRYPQGAQSQLLICNDTATIVCIPGVSAVLTGAFTCEGGGCPVPGQTMNWELFDPAHGSVASGPLYPNPYFGLTLPPAYFQTSGVYELHLIGHCGASECPCIIYLNVEACSEACPCELADILALQAAVNAGFATVSSGVNCRACFAPVALSDCETVEWHLNTANGSLLGTSTGNQLFCWDFSQSGAYTIVMVVKRFKADGSICEVFTYSKTINLLCVPTPVCDESVFGNPTFSIGATTGGLNSGGASEGWAGPCGNPTVLEGIEEGNDPWGIRLLGNLDSADVLGRMEPVCLDKTSGTVSLRLSVWWWNDDPPRMDWCPPKVLERLVIQLYRGDEFEMGDCNGIDCYELISMPLPDDSTTIWFDVDIPYDLSGWAVLDSCGDPTHGVLVRPAIFVTNGLGIDQGSDTYSNVILDQFCLDGTLVGTETPNRTPDLRIFPNPNTGIFTVELSEPAAPGTVFRVVGVTGQTLLEQAAQPGLATQTVDAGALPAGLYFLQVVADGRVTAVEKFVKQW